MFRYVISFLENLVYMFQGYAILLYDLLSGHRNKRANMRMRICKDCEFYSKGICKECGCILKAKTRCMFPLDSEGKSIGGCPEHKW